MKIDLTNKTDYRTSDIRRLLSECIRRDGIYFDRFRVRVEWSRRYGSHGVAWLNSGNMKLFLLRPDREARSLENELRRYSRRLSDGQKEWLKKRIQEARMRLVLEDAETIAELIMHELQHCKGLEHEDMLDDDEAFDCSWAKDYPLRLTEVKIEHKEDVQLKRYRNVLKHIKEKEAVIERNQKLLKKWRKKKKYYERVFNSTSES